MKKIMKSILSLLLALVCIFSTFAISGSAKSQKTNDVLFDYEPNCELSTDDESVYTLYLRSGTVTSCDFQVFPEEGYTLSRIERSDDLEKLFNGNDDFIDALSEKNGKVSMAIIGGVSEDCALYNFYFKTPEDDNLVDTIGFRVVFDSLYDGNYQKVSAHILYRGPLSYTLFLNDDMELNCKESAICSVGTVCLGNTPTFRYSSSDPRVARVDEITGEIYAAKRGSANITVTVTDSDGNTFTDTCKVTVEYTWWQWIIKIVLFGWIWY